jgi:vitellogenic carboxypeptidase-like protein
MEGDEEVAAHHRGERAATRLEADNKKHHAKVFNLAGVLIGSGLTEPRAQVMTHADVMHDLGLIDEVQRARARAMQARIVRLIDMEEWDAAHRARDELLTYLEKAAGVATLLDVRRAAPYRDHVVADYLNQAEVREALGAKAGEMAACNKAIPDIMTEDIMKGYADVLAMVVSRVPVLLFQGQFDVKDGYASTVAWLRDLRWAGAPHFQMAEREIWEVDGRRAGYWKQYSRLTHAVVLDAGHMVPHDQPEAALALATRFIDDCLHRTRDD